MGKNMKKTFVISLCLAMTILASCNESESWKADTACNDNELRCYGSQLLICQNAEWVLSNDCAADGRICENDTNNKAACIELPAEPCVPSCKDNKATRCDSEGTAIVDNCSESQVCGFDENGAPACVEKKACVPSCKDGQLTTCGEDLVASTSKCAENEVCGFDENGVPACVDAFFCTFGETKLFIGDKSCDNDGLVVTCQEDGTMSAGVECTKGVCTNGECIRRDCGEAADGKNVCKDNKLMICDDGILVEDTENACGEEMPLCRDGEFECSAYKDCGTIEHGKNGCKDGNIVDCKDGETTVVDGGNCVENQKLCIADDIAEAGFICKDPDPTDCQWNGGLVAKNETVCDGNILRTCSADKDGVLSTGFECSAKDMNKSYCNPKLNICRAYYHCGENDEIAHGAVVCNDKGTNKAQCIDGKIFDLKDDICDAPENASPVCTFDAEAVCSFECKLGYFKKNDACELIAMCDPVKEKYNNSDNTCSCNENANWAGTAGSCVCKDGYLQIGNTCILKNTCSLAHNVLDETSNTCVCDVENHWIGKASSCQCEDGYVAIDNVCQAVVSCTVEHTIWNKSTNACVCDTAGHWTENNSVCKCIDGYVEVSGECQIKRTCDVNREKFDETINTCLCDSDKGWTGTAGECVCNEGKVQVGNTCEEKATCTGDGQIYIENANICGCDGSKGWVSDGSKCVCLDKYVNLAGVCTLKAVCDVDKEKYDEATNTCLCDSDKGWTGTAGGCVCSEGKVQVGNTCETKAVCDKVGQIYAAGTNVCACDEANGWIDDGISCTCNVLNGWTENAGTCTCEGEVPMIVVGGRCEVRTECDASKNQVLDETTNECVCDSANSWEGNVNSCECTLYKNSECTSTTALVAGDVVKFGKYEWIVLDNTSDGVKLLLKESVGMATSFCNGECRVFDKNYNSWKDASIRSYLNDTFYNTDAEFSVLQKAKIQATVLSGVGTKDKVFLLGKNDIALYKDIPGVTSFDGYYWWLIDTHENPNYSEYAYIYNTKDEKIDTWTKSNRAEVRPVVVIK